MTVFWLAIAFNLGLLFGAAWSGIRRERAENLAHDADPFEDCQ